MRTKGSIIILLVGLLFVKVSAFHVYAHQNADNQAETCGYCDLAVENQQAELTPGFSALEVPTPPAEHLETQIELPHVEVVSFHLSSFLFTRPPPVIGYSS